MKSKVTRQVSTLLFSSLLFFSHGVFAADWTWAEDEIVNSNFGQAAGWVIDSVVFEGGEEYIVEDAVCKDYLVTVAKHRDSNPQGRGKFQEVVEVEIETFCQPLEEDEI